MQNSFNYNDTEFDTKTLSILGLKSGDIYKCDIVDSDDEDEDMIAYKKSSIERKKRLAILIQQKRAEREAQAKADNEEEENDYIENSETREALERLEKKIESFKNK
jgi:hypothetical protein